MGRHIRLSLDLPALLSLWLFDLLRANPLSIFDHSFSDKSPSFCGQITRCLICGGIQHRIVEDGVGFLEYDFFGDLAKAF